MKGSLHNHSTWSDGHNQLEEIAEYMDGLGLDCWAVTDHSKSSCSGKNGLDAKRVREQIKEIRKLNERLAGRGCNFRLLTGTEVDIFCATGWISTMSC